MRPDNTQALGSLVPGADRSGYIPVLDGWRAVAISLVVAFHALLNADLSPNSPALRIAGITAKCGPFGVLIFFAISGYLITGRIVAESLRSGRFSLKSFYYKRAFRILPLSYLYLLTILLLYLARVVHLTSGDWGAPFFISNYTPSPSWFTAHFWSLSIEEHFYLLWPPVIFFMGWRRAVWPGIAAIVLVGIWRPYYLARVSNPASQLLHTDLRLDFLLISAVFAISVVRWPWFRSCLHAAGSTAGFLIVSAALLFISSTSFLVSRSIQAILLGVLVCGTSLGASALIRVVLTNRFVLWLGQISYSVYIIQQLFFAPSSWSFLNRPWVEAAKVPLILLAAGTSYRYVEKPMMNYARRKARRSAG